VRAFVAVFAPPEVRRALVGAARELPVVGEVRWARPENVHLTLKLLGGVSKDNLGRVAEVLEPVCGRHEPFKAEPSGFGTFPSARKARILWASIGEGSAPLRALAKDVEASLESLGFGCEDRSYMPHLTLGRARGQPVVVEATETPSTIPGLLVLDSSPCETSALAGFRKRLGVRAGQEDKENSPRQTVVSGCGSPRALLLHRGSRHSQPGAPRSPRRRSPRSRGCSCAGASPWWALSAGSTLTGAACSSTGPWVPTTSSP
jgi:2'-5' RNA ligase